MKYLILFSTILWLSTSLSLAAAPDIGKVRTVSGEAFLIRDGARALIAQGTVIHQKDIIETGDMGTVGITFNDSTVLSTGPNSTVHLEKFAFNPSNLKGNFLANLKNLPKL